MAKIDFNNPHFELKIKLNSSLQDIKIHSQETTDGDEYFICELNDEQITQVRREKDGNWEQIWGKLDPTTVNAIGAAISAKIKKQQNK